LYSKDHPLVLVRRAANPSPASFVVGQPGYDDYTVMETSTRMLARYTHPTEERKIGALDRRR